MPRRPRRQMIDEALRQRRESGRPGGGQGRRDRVGRTGVFPVSAMEGASGQAVVHPEPAWGQGERGAAGYENHGQSELFYLEEELPRRRLVRKPRPRSP